MKKDIKLGFIGFGKMANAICSGAIKSGFIDKSNVYTYDINKTIAKESAQKLGINFVEDVKLLTKEVSTILLATKPFVCNEVISEIKNISKDKLIISILAGIPTKKFEDNIEGARIVRVMPNTPAMVNEGMSVVSGGKSASVEDVQFVLELFSNLGCAINLDESKINAVTAVSGSGPAFYYYIIDLIAKAGEAIGLDYNTSLLLSAQTAKGASKMILETKKAPCDLIDAVTTPNGTTYEGNKVLMASNLEKILLEAIQKTNNRAIELGCEK